MKSMSALNRTFRNCLPLWEFAQACTVAALAGAALVVGMPATAQTPLADQPLFATTNVPGNLALVLSVEFPTAVSVAHTNRSYSPTNAYLGFFDPNKCYVYSYSDGTSTANYFAPSSPATNRTCNVSPASGQWSGNFLNWASMQTIDPFRWVLTGGYRVIDLADTTVVEKAWATGQGGTGNFPDSTLNSTTIAGATPFPASTPTFSMRIQGLGNKMRFAVPDNASSAATFNAEYFSSKNLSGPVTFSRTETSIAYERYSGAWPSPVVPKDNVSARWTGTVTAGAAGNYQFRVRGDDGVRLTVDGNVLPGGTDTGWRDQGATNYDSQTFNVSAGHVFSVTVEWYQGGGGAEISLQWTTPASATFAVIGGGTPSLYDAAVPFNPTTAKPAVGGVVYETFMRAKVCDPTIAVGGVEANCKQYGLNYKPEGLLQKYSNKIRYSAFGYLNDSNILRDGGVLRAQQKFVGPTKPVPGSTAVNNSAAEWDASTGVFNLNPDKPDADATAAIMGLPTGTVISNSGVLNYLNKFGELTPGSYKTYDNVSELYYAAIRYFKNLPSVPEWTNVTGATDPQKITWTDGFPVITSALDPILYSCQRNFVLGIGDVNTHADKNLPGRVQSGSEPGLPALVSGDASVNATTATDKVGALEGLGNIGTNATYNTPAIAGLAYDSHTKDIRPDSGVRNYIGADNTLGVQTIDTYWVDVQEYQAYVPNNQFYLATKYGGFTVPVGYQPYANTTALPTAWWSTSGDILGGQSRPDNYFAGGRPDLVKAGLTAAFDKIASAIAAYTTSFSTSLPQVATSGNSSFSSKYDAATWTGEVTASNLSFDPATGDPSVVKVWDFTAVLGTQLANGGWNTARRIATWNGSAGVPFRDNTLTTDQMNQLDTSYVTADDRLNYLNYLRGDQTHETASTATGSTHTYRTRTKLLGDIVGSKARPWGRPAFPFSDSTNPGYSAFKTLWKDRRTVVYVGANDGMMHAINGALATAPTTPPSPAMENDPDAGKEMFAYVPSSLFRGPNNTPNTDGLASLGNSAFAHHHMVNATPILYDIDFSRTPGSSGGPNWHSVLIGGMGKGGRTYYALDVTDPQGIVSGGETTLANKVMWEFSRSTLGYTYGDALVAKTKKYGWVAVLLSGYNNDDGKGYFIFVNPRTGAFLEEVSTGVGTVSNSAGLAHGEAFIVDSSDGTADAIYAGDLLGNVWRLDVTALTGNYPAPVNLAQLVSPSGGAQPVTSRPSVEIHPRTKKRFVMLGTGRLLDQTDISSRQEQSFYAISDGTNAAFNTTLPSPLVFPINRANLLPNTSTDALGSGLSFGPTDMGWYEDLGVDAGTPATPSTPAVPGTGIGWRVVSDSSTFAGSVAFAAILPNGDVCSPSGNSRVYGRDFAVATTTVKNAVVLTKALYISLSGNVTDLRYLSVNGRPTLISGTDTGSVGKIDINPLGSLSMRRLNWREVELVD